MTEATMTEKSKGESNDKPTAEVAKPAGGSEAAKPAATGATPSPPPRRQLGVKEPIIFKWKLLGSAGDVVLTLFKSTERDDVDAQFERVQREGYYKNLEVVEADAKVAQTKKVKETLDKERKKMGSAAEKKARDAKKPRSKERLAEPKLIRIGRTKAAKARAAAALAAAAAKKAAKKAKKKKKKKAPAKTKKTAKKKVTKKTKKKAAAKKKVKKTVKKKAKAKATPARKKKSASSSTKRRKR